MLYLDIHPETFERIANSPAVLALEGQPRFDLFRHPGTTPEQWHQWLDIDFENRQHLIKTALLATGICELEHTDAPTARAVVLTALVHDAAESVVGDRNYHLKEVGDDTEEIGIIDELVTSGELDLTSPEPDTVLEIMGDKHSGKASDAGILFDLAEIIGYAHSGITAWRAAHDNSTEIPAPQREVLRLLPVHVFGGQFAHLRAYHDAGRVSPAHFFDTFTDEISTILDYGAEVSVREVLHRHQVTSGLPEEKSRQILADLETTTQLWLGRTGLRVVA